MDVYDELAVCSSDEDEDDSLYEPFPIRDSRREAKTTLQKSCHDKENKNPQIAASLIDLLKDGEDGKKVTVELCKDYLRTHGLRLVGTKAVLIERVKGHIQDKKNNGFAQHSEATLTSNCGVPKSPTGPIHEDLIKSFSNMDLDHVCSADIIKFLKDEKKLTVSDCKAYLRKRGLRLTGTKQILIERIKEHLQIQDNNGMTKYPEATFIIDCQGDACIGDVVLFKQRVYDFFNVGGRCSAGPPVGVRTIAGRIIKESYGSAKQQHTFTVEVLWSTGDRPLPPLHPLIIKGRNLYRVKTLRQAWADEPAREKQLQEKHARGAAARKERRARIEGRKPNGHTRKHEDRVCKTINGIGSHLGNDNRKEKSNINYPLANSGTKVEPSCEMSANIHASKDGLLCKPNTSIHAAKLDTSCKNSASVHSVKFEPSCKASAVIHAAKVDPFCKGSASVHTTKVEPSCRNSASVHTAMVEPCCRNSASTHAGKVDIVCSTSTFMHARNVEPVSSVEVRFSRSLAGLIIGKEWANCNLIERVSEAKLCVKKDPANPTLCIVTIRGTTQQKDVALKMVYEKTCCKFFAKTRECKNGETCKFSHALLGIRV